ncbi:MAG: SOS response-associated peptidase [Deltaproteobacteria bacterium]|nr:MAG: SOS response-associated peptidase [Deltaproteobacteria bacterium]
MCGRFTLTSSGQELAQRFELGEVPTLAPRFNIAPSQDVAIVRQPAGTAGRLLELRRWGLVPRFARDPRIGNRMINARSETLHERRAFRDAFRKRRCLVPADGFFEWRRRGGVAQPYYIRRVSNGPFAFAGLYEHWEGPEGACVDSCTVITTDANARIRAVHERMPVILDPAAFALWLDPAVDAAERLAPLLAPCPDDWLELHPVSPRVNDPTWDAPSCIEPTAELQGSLF